MNVFNRIGHAMPKKKPLCLRPKIPKVSLALLIPLMCLCAVQQGFAQADPAAPASSNIQPLNIGDPIPDEVWNMPLQVVNHPPAGGKETITLADYKGKLIILDFWATWCSSCIAAMPRIHELEKEYRGEMVMIPITYEPADKATPFLSTNKTVEPLHMFSVVNDETIRATFPHRLIPHYVWISPSGEVGAITTSERVNAGNIELLLGGEQVKIPVRKDIDADKPLFLSGVIELEDLTHYSVFTKGKYDGLPSGNRYRKEKGSVRGRAITNLTILDMYQAVARRLLEKMGDTFSGKRLIVDVVDTTKLISQKSAHGEVANLYNYELIVPVELSDSLYEYMLQDLNRYTAYHGRIEKREVRCLMLVNTGDLDRIKTRGGKPDVTLVKGGILSMVNQPLSVLVKRLNSRSEIPLPVVDEIGFFENVDLDFSGNLDLDTLKEELRAQGLDLVEGYRQLNMFILEDKPVSSY